MAGADGFATVVGTVSFFLGGGEYGTWYRRMFNRQPLSSQRPQLENDVSPDRAIAQMIESFQTFVHEATQTRLTPEQRQNHRRLRQIRKEVKKLSKDLYMSHSLGPADDEADENAAVSAKADPFVEHAATAAAIAARAKVAGRRAEKVTEKSKALEEATMEAAVRDAKTGAFARKILKGEEFKSITQELKHEAEKRLGP